MGYLCTVHGALATLSVKEWVQFRQYHWKSGLFGIGTSLKRAHMGHISFLFGSPGFSGATISSYSGSVIGLYCWFSLSFLFMEGADIGIERLAAALAAAHSRTETVFHFASPFKSRHYFLNLCITKRYLLQVVASPGGRRSLHWSNLPFLKLELLPAGIRVSLLCLIILGLVF